MRLVLINDSHWGVHDDDYYYSKMIVDFHKNVLFPYIKKNDIKTIFHLGDLVEKRKSINYQTSNIMCDNFFDVCRDEKIDIFITPGNHDSFYANSLRVTSLSELVEDKYDNVTIIDDPREIRFDKLDILCMPWICKENEEKSMKMLVDTKCSVVFGHFEISGFDMYPGMTMKKGMDKGIFQRFNRVLSGHYHHKSDDRVIHYLGTQYELTWSDYSDPKGFHVFDTETLEIEFIENPSPMFHKIEYDDTDTNYSEMDLGHLIGRTVKLVVVEKNDLDMYESFYGRLNDMDLAKFISIDNVGLSISEEISDGELSENILIVMENFLNESTIPKNIKKPQLNKLIKALYIEASQ